LAFRTPTFSALFHLLLYHACSLNKKEKQRLKKITIRDRIRYHFDNVMSKGPIALIGWLFIVSAVLIAFVSLVVISLGIGPEGKGTFLEVAWASLMRTLDPGTMGGDEGHWSFLLAMLTVTFGGIFIVSILIGVLTTGIEGKLEQLRKGRSFVAETGHTVILGWSSQIFTLISELIEANANQRHSCIAILAEKDTVEMQDEIRTKIGKTGRTRIVCRTGSPIDMDDLDLVNPQSARAIVILAPEVEDPDFYVIKSILALTNDKDRSSQRYHVVAVIRDVKNFEVARMIGGDEVKLILVGDMMARIMAQTCRQSGLSVAYTELLDFGGDEIYFTEEPGLTGNTFAESLQAYENSAIIGIRFHDGRLEINPPMETRIAGGDKLIAISEDDDTVRLSGLTEHNIESGAIREIAPSAPATEHTLMLGWNERASSIIKELDHYVGPDSRITIVHRNAIDVDAHFSLNGNGDLALRNMAVSFHSGETTDRQTLEGLDVHSFDHIIVLSTGEEDETPSDPQEADARTLITLLHLRDMSDKSGQPLSIVSEMLDIKNRELAQVTRADDFVVSDNLLSLMLSQISENAELAQVFQILFDPEGSEIYLKPAEEYVAMDTPVNFYTVVEAARRRNQVAIGYRIMAEAYDADKSYGVKINPAKSLMTTYAKGDRIIVLAED
jgi:ion channel POLLUX/CASTOR